MNMPWADPNYDIMADLRKAHEAMKNQPWTPQYTFYNGKRVTLQDLERHFGMTSSDSVAILSGGLDSTTMVYDMIDKGFDPHCLSFNYGQRHAKELTFAANTCKQLGLLHDVIDLSGITNLISNSALTAPFRKSADGLDVIHIVPGSTIAPRAREVEVPDGHYAEETMKQTVVPNRNMIMLSIAAGVAVNENARTIGFGVHSGDHFIYPDCRPRFVAAANAAIVIGNSGFGPIRVQAEATMPDEFISVPFLHATKADIAYRALELGVPLHMTWSCYKGGLNHCGRCGTCVERLEAIAEAQARYIKDHAHEMDNPYSIEDNTVYDDNEYWKQAIREAKNG